MPTEVVYLQRWHGWCHMELLPSRHVLCIPDNFAPCHFMQNHMRKVHACLTVTSHLDHLGQRQSHKTVCLQTTTFEERGEPKRNRTEVPLLTSLTPSRLTRKRMRAKVCWASNSRDRTRIKLKRWESEEYSPLSIPRLNCYIPS